MTTTEASFYATPSPTSSLARHADRTPKVHDPAQAAAIARNCVLHVAAVERLAPDLPAERWADVETRSAARIADRVFALNSAPLDAPRAPADRMIGNCYHVALLTCALLRASGIPTRTRVGFSGHLEPGKFTDHWICEVLDDSTWHRIDADAGLPVGHPHATDFQTGGEAWQRCRLDEADPELYGFEDSSGWWFIRNNVVRDLASLCRVELLPWDWWGLMVAPEADRPIELIDELAVLATERNPLALQARFETDPLLNPEGRVLVFRGSTTEIRIPDDW